MCIRDSAGRRGLTRRVAPRRAPPRRTELRFQCSVGIGKLGSQDSGDLAAEGGDVQGCRSPDFIPGDTEVMMHDDIAHALRLGPRNLGVALAPIAGYTRGSLADYRQLVRQRALEHRAWLEYHRNIAPSTGTGRAANTAAAAANSPGPAGHVRAALGCTRRSLPRK